MKQTAILIVVLILAIAVGVGVQSARRPGVIHRQFHTVKPDEIMTVEMEVYHSVYLFGYRLPYTSVERRNILGSTLHDLDGKLIGRFHDAGAKLCPHCNGVGEVKEESR